MLRTFVVLLLITTICCACSSSEDASAPDATMANPCADPAFRQEIWSGFQSEVLSSDTDQTLKDWLISEHTPDSDTRPFLPYELAFIHARCRNKQATIKVLVTYYGGIGGKARFFKGGWSQEKENLFRDLLEAYTENIYRGQDSSPDPAYDFVFHFNNFDDPNAEHWTAEEAKVIVVVGYSGISSYADGKTVRLIYPSIIGHELGHLCPNPEDGEGICFAFGHHYCGDNFSDLTCGPPKEAEGQCIMARNGHAFGPTEQLMSLLADQQDSTELIQTLGREMEAMLSHSNTSFLTQPTLQRELPVFLRGP